MNLPESSLIEVDHVTKVFKTQAGDVAVLKNVTTQVQRGEFVSVTGRSGSGKSTLINMMSGIDHPTSGTVQIGGTVLHRMREGKLSVWRGKNLGIVFQFFQLLPTLTLLENILLPMDFSCVIPPADRTKRAMQLLKQVELEEYAEKIPGELSGGQQQCAAVARALANDPPVILADEPTGNLDTQSAENVFRIFHDMALSGKTIIMVTHDRNLAQRADRALVICDGELVNPVISTTFPEISHNLMLQLSQSLSDWNGEEIAGQPVLLFVEDGVLTVRVNGIAIPVIKGSAWSNAGFPDQLLNRIKLEKHNATVRWIKPDILSGLIFQHAGFSIILSEVTQRWLNQFRHDTHRPQEHQ